MASSQGKKEVDPIKLLRHNKGLRKRIKNRNETIKRLKCEIQTLNSKRNGYRSRNQTHASDKICQTDPVSRSCSEDSCIDDMQHQTNRHDAGMLVNELIPLFESWKPTPYPVNKGKPRDYDGNWPTVQKLTKNYGERIRAMRREHNKNEMLLGENTHLKKQLQYYHGKLRENEKERIKLEIELKRANKDNICKRRRMEDENINLNELKIDETNKLIGERERNEKNRNRIRELKQQKQHLERELESTRKRHDNDIHNLRANLNKAEAEFDKERAKDNDELAEDVKTRAHLNKINQRLQQDNDRLREIIDREQRHNEEDDKRENQHRSEITELKEQLQQAETEHNKLADVLIQQLPDKANELGAESNAHQRIQIENSKMKEQITELKTRLNNYPAKTKELEKELLMYEEKDTKNGEEIKGLRYDLDSTQTRLSRLMSDKLTDNNPNITDLSDMNRPTKLAERYTELYDNQWTDAFDVIDTGDEVATINKLLDILYSVFEYCKEAAIEQTVQIERALYLHGDIGPDIMSHVRKNVKDCRKITGSASARQQSKMYTDHLQNVNPSLYTIVTAIPEYVEECCQLCWLMCIQDPPVVLGTAVKQGQTFDTSLYRAYTVTGPEIEFEVWPPLFLHQGGQTLCKGVAQGCKSSSSIYQRSVFIPKGHSGFAN